MTCTPEWGARGGQPQPSGTVSRAEAGRGRVASTVGGTNRAERAGAAGWGRACAELARSGGLRGWAPGCQRLLSHHVAGSAAQARAEVLAGHGAGGAKRRSEPSAHWQAPQDILRTKHVAGSLPRWACARQRGRGGGMCWAPASPGPAVEEPRGALSCPPGGGVPLWAPSTSPHPPPAIRSDCSQESAPAPA